jgi:hypothetical protein
MAAKTNRSRKGQGSKSSGMPDNRRLIKRFPPAYIEWKNRYFNFNGAPDSPRYVKHWLSIVATMHQEQELFRDLVNELFIKPLQRQEHHHFDKIARYLKDGLPRLHVNDYYGDDLKWHISFIFEMLLEHPLSAFQRKLPRREDVKEYALLSWANQRSGCGYNVFQLMDEQREELEVKVKELPQPKNWSEFWGEVGLKSLKPRKGPNPFKSKLNSASEYHW